MSITPPKLAQALAAAQTEHELRLRYMDAAGELFQAQHWGLYLYQEGANIGGVDLKGLPDRFVDYYKTDGLTVDPVMQYVLETHTPAHEQMIMTEVTWKQSVLYLEGCGKQFDHEHIMAGPIVAQGRIIGTLHFARTSHTPAFNSQDVMCLSAVCSHLSVCLATLRLRSQISFDIDCLTPRESQIAALVATGLTNAEIGAELWISQNTVKQALKRIFRKLNVSSRTQMTSWLQQSPHR